MAQSNVTFHRTSQKQGIIKSALIRAGKISEEAVKAYDGLELGDDDTVNLVRPLASYEVYDDDGNPASLLSVGDNCSDLALVETYAVFGGKVISVAKEVRYTATVAYDPKAVTTDR